MARFAGNAGLALALTLAMADSAVLAQSANLSGNDAATIGGAVLPQQECPAGSAPPPPNAEGNIISECWVRAEVVARGLIRIVLRAN